MNYRSSDTNHDFLQQKKHLVILFTLIAVGWVFSFLQIVALTSGMGLSRLGPGMNVLTFLTSQPSALMAKLISTMPVCSSFELTWTIENLIGSILMWLGMVLAMMGPTLLTPELLRPMKINTFFSFFLGYVSTWFVFCIFGVTLQWCLQAYKVLDNSLVINNPTTSAMILLVIGGVQAFKPKLTHKPFWLDFSPFVQNHKSSFFNNFKSGLNRGGICVYSCSPLMMVMFVFGLMNLVAMAVLTAVMYLLVNNVTTRLARATGFAFIVSGMLLLGLNYA